MKVNTKEIKLKNPAAIIAADANYNSTRLAISQQGAQTSDSILCLADLKSLTEKESLERYQYNTVSSVAFSFKQAVLFYSKNDYYIDVFDLNKLKIVNSIESSQNRKIKCAKNSPKIILCGLLLEVWDMESVSRIWQYDNYKAFEVHEKVSTENLNVSWNPDSLVNDKYITMPPVACFFQDETKILYAGINEAKIFLYDFMSGRSDVFLNDGAFQCYDMKLSASNDYLCISANLPAGEFIWDLNTRERVMPDIFNEKYGSSSVIDFHPTKNVIALGSLVGFLTLVDLDRKKTLFSESIHKAKISQVIFINEGLGIITTSADGKVFVTDVSDVY